MKALQTCYRVRNWQAAQLEMQKLKGFDQASLIIKASSELEEIRNSCTVKSSSKVQRGSNSSVTLNRSFSQYSGSKKLSIKPDERIARYHSTSSSQEISMKNGHYDSGSRDSKNRRQLQTKRSKSMTDVTAASDHKFPPSCLNLLFSLPGNNKCVDCGEERPDWASVSYGVLLCLNCCGRHRGLGVQVSFLL